MVAAVGIYDASGTKLIDSGTFDVGSTGFKQNSFTSVTLQPGIYSFAWSCDGIVAQCRFISIGLGIVAASYTNQGTAIRRGRGSNAMAAGVLPSTLGTLTSLNHGCPISYWEP